MEGINSMLFFTLVLSFLFSGSHALAMEVVDCVADEYISSVDLGNFGAPTFKVTAKFRNEASLEVPKDWANLRLGYMEQGDCECGKGGERSMNLDAAIQPRGIGLGRGSFSRPHEETAAGVPIKWIEGKCKLTVFVTTDIAGERGAAALRGKNCTFEPEKIKNPKNFLVCKIEPLKRK
jgi:hypothetical protein